MFVENSYKVGWKLAHGNWSLIVQLQKQPPEVFYKKGVLKNFASACNVIWKETLTQVFSYEFLRNFKEQLSYRTPPGDCFWNYIIIL